MIFTRSEFINWLLYRLDKTGSFGRMFQKGEIEHLGYFYQVPPFNRPGYITISRTINNTYIVATTKKTIGELCPFIILDIPWEYWDGDKKVGAPLFRGDNPDEYKKKRDARNSQGEQRPTETS